MLKHFSILVAVMLGALCAGLTACGSDDDSDEPEYPDEGTASNELTINGEVINLHRGNGRCFPRIGMFEEVMHNGKQQLLYESTFESYFDFSLNSSEDNTIYIIAEAVKEYCDVPLDDDDRHAKWAALNDRTVDFKWINAGNDLKIKKVTTACSDNNIETSIYSGSITLKKKAKDYMILQFNNFKCEAPVPLKKLTINGPVELPKY